MLASVWLMGAFGILGSIRAEKAQAAAGQGISLAMVLLFSGILPILLPPGFNSVVWGVGSAPLMVWTSLMSYSDVATALANPLRPTVPWLGLIGGQSPMILFLCWLIAIVGPALGGFWIWRYTIIHFDWLVGRPHRPAAETRLDAAPPHPVSGPPPAVTRSRRGSPLAEPDGAV
jgi:hypothetical protein